MAKQIKRIGALVLALLVILTAIPMSSITAEAATKKQPTKATKITVSPSSVSVKAKATSGNIKLKLNKKADKKVTITVKSADKSIAKVTKASVTVAKGKKVSGAFKVKGVKKGSTKVTVSFKNSKGKTIKKTFKVKVTKAAASTTDDSTPTDDTTVTVTETTAATTAEVASALANTKLTKLTISTQEAATIDIPAGDYSKVALVVNAPKASVTNAGKFKSVEIDAIAGNTWYEKAVGNVITVIAKVARIIAQSGSSIQSITVATPAGTKAATDVVKVEAQAGGEVKTVDVATASAKVEATASGADAKIGTVEVSAANADVDAKAEAGASIAKVEVAAAATGADVDVTANGTGKVAEVSTAAKADITVGGSTTEAVKVSVASTAEGTTVEATTKVEVSNAAKNTEVDLKNGAAGSTVKTEGSGETKTENSTGSSVKVTDTNGNETTVNNGRTGTTTETGTTSTSTSTDGSGGSTGGGSSSGGSSSTETGLTLSYKKMCIGIGNNKSGEIGIVDLDDSDIEKVKWESNNTNVATVKADEESKGKWIVTGVAKGEASITATLNGKSAVCEVVVSETQATIPGTFKASLETKDNVKSLKFTLENVSNLPEGRYKVTVGDNWETVDVPDGDQTGYFNIGGAENPYILKDFDANSKVYISFIDIKNKKYESDKKEVTVEGADAGGATSTPSASATLDGTLKVGETLTEANKITVTISDGELKETAPTITVEDLPEGVTAGTVTKTSNTVAVIPLAGKPTAATIN